VSDGGGSSKVAGSVKAPVDTDALAAQLQSSAVSAHEALAALEACFAARLDSRASDSLLLSHPALR
jgi:hypothetical protein